MPKKIKYKGVTTIITDKVLKEFNKKNIDYEQEIKSDIDKNLLELKKDRKYYLK